MKKPYPTTFDRIRITRLGESADIEYLEPGVCPTHFTVGPGLIRMTDEEVFGMFNDGLLAVCAHRRRNPYRAVEIPAGKPQIKYDAQSGQWCPCGNVVRGVIGGRHGAPVIEIDKHDLGLEEFGTLLSTYMGWGMRLVFVPDDETHLSPAIEVRDPKKGG